MIKNILDDIPETMSAELVNIMQKSDNIRIERIVSTGQSTPEHEWYDQDENEWVMLLEGYAGITFEGSKEILLHKGDFVFIPAHKKHRVSFTTKHKKSVWLAVFFK